MTVSLRNKTIFGVAFIEASLMALLIVTAIHFMRDMVNDDLQKRAMTTASLFATATKNAVLSYDLASLDSFSNDLLENPDIEYVKITDAQGNTLSQAGDEAKLNRPFSQDSSLRNVDDGTFDTRAQIVEAGQLFGRIELGISISTISKNLAKIQGWISSIALTEMILVALFSYFLGSYLTSQLKNLQKAAKAISQGVVTGNFNRSSINITGKDELSEVAKSFNKLVTSLQKTHNQRRAYQEQLEELNRTLEQKVQKRTSMLEAKNHELTHATHAIQEKQSQLMQAEKMASIGQLAAGIAHEINNPIGFVSSNLDTLEQYVAMYKQLFEDLRYLLEHQDDTQQQHKLEQVAKFFQLNDFDYINTDVEDLLKESIDGLKRVRDIVQGLKQFSRVDSNEMILFDVNDVILTTLKMVNNELKYHCSIEQDLSPLPKVKLNIGKLSQVFTNLLINASQAIEGNGHIRISTTSDNDNIVIQIEDTGKGIKPEHFAKLFDPFFTTKGEGIGTGLGLAISYGIIQEHGGDIHVSSEVGKGTCFTITLPTVST